MGCVPSFQMSFSNCSFYVDEVCKHVRTGDLIFFSGTRITAKEISAVTQSPWSHVAMVFVNPKDPPGNPVIIESVTHGDSKISDIITKKPASGGTRMVPLRTALENFDGNAVALRELRATAGCRKKLSEHILRVVFRDISMYHGKPYEDRWGEFFFAKFPCFFAPKKSTDDKFFCSELIARILIDCDLLDGTRVCANKFFPSDLSETSGIELQSPLQLPGVAVEYGPNKYVVLNGKKGDFFDGIFANSSTSPPKN